MQTLQLPARPSMENLRKQAKSLLKAAKQNDPEARDRIGPFFGDPAAITLQQAQLVVAREYGFSSWTALKRHVEEGAPEGQTLDQLATRFLDLVCLAYRTDVFRFVERFDEAADLLARHPGIRGASIHVAAAIGDDDAVRRWLDENPALIEAKGGFYHWPPLMYAAYARLPGVSSFPAAQVLLQRGADPNAHYMWDGTYRFTALTGVFGQGEGGPVSFPEHPDLIPFSEALLDAGANPNDGQVLYNRCFEPDNTAFEMLLRYGLTNTDKNNWEDSDHDVLHFHLVAAIRRGFFDRVKLLAEAGADLDKPDDTYETLTKGLTPYQSALLRGDARVAAYLKSKGAKADEPEGAAALQAAIMLGQTDRAREIMTTDPAAAAELESRHSDMLDAAADVANVDALRTMIALGFNLNPPESSTPMHAAALHGHVDVLRLLVEAGADMKQRDPVYFSPPLGHALHVGQKEAIAFLETCDADIFNAAARGDLKQIDARLGEDAAWLNRTFGEVRPGKDRLCDNDWATPLWFAVVNGRSAAVEHLLDLGADRTLTDDAGRGLIEIARSSGHEEIAEMLSG